MRSDADRIRDILDALNSGGRRRGSYRGATNCLPNGGTWVAGSTARVRAMHVEFLTAHRAGKRGPSGVQTDRKRAPGSIWGPNQAPLSLLFSVEATASDCILLVAKVDVAGSNPVSRSIPFRSHFSPR